MGLCLESGLISVIRAAANCISCWADLMTMSMLHGPACRGRFSVCLGALCLLAFTAVHAETPTLEDIFPPVGISFPPVDYGYDTPVEVDADLDVMVAGAPGTHHVGPLMIQLFFTL
jgi:hypothetical protein